MDDIFYFLYKANQNNKKKTKRQDKNKELIYREENPCSIILKAA